MDKHVFMQKFSRTVRWRLPKSEADEVLSDYEEIFSHDFEGSTEVSVQKVGEPIQAAKALTNPKCYYQWLAVFAITTLCLILPEFLLLRARFYHYPNVLMYILFLLGVTVSEVWFRSEKGEKRKAPMPKGLMPALFGVIGLTAAAVLIIAGFAAKIWGFIPNSLYGRAARWTLVVTGTAAMLFGMFGLVKARLSDCRWRSLYLFCLTILTECVLVLALLVSMSTDTISAYWWMPYAADFGIIGIAGLIGTGVSLC